MFSSLKKAFDSDKEQLRSIIEKGTKATSVLVEKPSGPSELDINFVHIASEWPWTYHEISIIDNDNYIIGDSDGLATHMHVSGDDAEAFIVGHLSSTCEGGTVSVTCCLGPDQPCSTNMLVFYCSMDGYTWNHNNPPCLFVTWSSMAEYYAASFSEPFNYIVVSTWSPSTEYNSCLSVDSVTVSTSGGPSSTVLTIATTQGGTTSPEPGGYYYYGQTAEVYAIPYENYVFDHWDIDFGNYQSTDNPIYQQTWDGDHYVTAYFAYDPNQQWIIIDYADGGYTTPGAGTYVGSGSMQITATAYNGFGFSYWLLTGNYLSSDPTIWVDYGANEVTPVFYNLNPPVTHQLTVYAINTYNEVPLYPNIYVDGCYVGSGYASVQVTEGYHNVEIDYWYGCYYCIGYSENWNGGIYSDTEMAAYYTLGGK